MLRELANAHAYVHTAAWEGNPVTVLEAASVGLPIVARDIPPVRHAGVDRLAATPIDMAQQVLALDDLDRWRERHEGVGRVRVAHGGDVAGRGAARALRLAAGRRSRPPTPPTPARFTASR